MLRSVIQHGNRVIMQVITCREVIENLAEVAMSREKMGQCRRAATQFIDHIDLSEGSGRSYRAAEYTHTQTHSIKTGLFCSIAVCNQVATLY